MLIIRRKQYYLRLKVVFMNIWSRFRVRLPERSYSFREMNVFFRPWSNTLRLARHNSCFINYESEGITWILGTAGSIYLFRDLVLAGNPESFFLIFCDILCDLPLNDMVRAREKWMKYMIMGVEVSFEIFWHVFRPGIW